MIRKHSSSRKRSVKINFEVVKPTSMFKTPMHSQCLTERSSNIMSPLVERRQLASEKKIVSIDLKQNQSKSIENSKGKKVVKMRKKVSADQISTKFTNSICSSDRSRIGKKDSIFTVKEPELKCFDQINSSELRNKHGSQLRDWDKIIGEKKRELYSYLYQMDKKVLTLERTMTEELQGKKSMMEILRKKIGGKQKENKAEPTIPINIKNIYKVSRLKASKKEL